MILEHIPWIRYGFGTIDSKAPEQPLATIKQVHSAVILEASGPGEQGEADALISSAASLAVAVKTADCVPILLADSVNRVVAAVHAGWRGTVQEIVRLTIERMEDRFGTKPEDIVAEVGPSIGPCCFEVGPEVARQFSKWNSALANRNRKEHLDLGDINCAQLCKAGVPAQHIRQIGLCTMCDPKLFHSYRRDREAAGRMMSWIRVV
jgi:YfiH family protein